MPLMPSACFWQASPPFARRRTIGTASTCTWWKKSSQKAWDVPQVAKQRSWLLQAAIETVWFLYLHPFRPRIRSNRTCTSRPPSGRDVDPQGTPSHRHRHLRASHVTSRSFRSSLTGSAASAIATMAARATSAHDNTLHVDIALGSAQREVRSEEGLHFLTGRTLRAGAACSIA